MPKMSWSFILSGMLHLVVVSSLFVMKTTESGEAPTSIEILTLEAAGPRHQSAQRAPRPQPKAPAPQAEPLTTAANIESAPATTPEPAPTSAASDELREGQDNLAEMQLGRQPQSPRERYLAQLRDAISRKQEYPRASRAFREEGVVLLRLTLGKDGSLSKLELLEGTPHQRLNDAAMNAATKAAPYGAFPQGLQYASWRVTLPVRFTLTRSE